MRRGPGQNQGNQPGQPNQQHMGGGGGGARRRRPRGRDRQPSVFTGPMDHSYRSGPGQDNGSGGQRPGARRGQQPQRFFQHPDVEPLSNADGPQPLIFAFVDDLFFSAKIQETARKLNIRVNFVKNEQEVFDQLEQAGVVANGNGQNGSASPALVIFDLNSNSGKPLQTIRQLKQRFKRATNTIGFLSHLQGDLKLKAQEAGCDMVLPRSAFSQNLPQLLRRHATTAEEESA
jgi:CheY-like chemotaxis protein